MATWHETMMLSSKSFRECHEDGKYGEDSEFPKELVSDYISISKQSSGSTASHYWSVYPHENGFEEGKSYKIVINDEVYEGTVDKIVDGIAEINCYSSETGEGLLIKYNYNNGNYLITYYNKTLQDSNPTVNFEVWELEPVEKKDEPIYITELPDPRYRECVKNLKPFYFLDSFEANGKVTTRFTLIDGFELEYNKNASGYEFPYRLLSKGTVHELSGTLTEEEYNEIIDAWNSKK